MIDVVFIIHSVNLINCLEITKHDFTNQPNNQCVTTLDSIFYL